MILVQCMGVVQCIRGALTVHMDRESGVRFVNGEIKTVQEKTYKYDIEVEWDRGVFDRAVRMLGERIQSEVRVEDVEEVLQAMDYLSTDTEKGGRIEWSREMFERAVKELGERHQCKVTAREVEEILHAMDYVCTGRVDMMHVSEYMKTGAEWSKESAVMMWDQEIFERAYNILNGRKEKIVNADDTVEILHLIEYLSIRKEWENACYTRLARKGMEDYKRSRKKAAIGDIEILRERMVREGKKTRSFELYMLHVLGVFTSSCGMKLTVHEKRKTLDLRSSSSREKKRTNKTKEWVLRVGVSDRYRRHRGVQRMAETLMEVMDMSVEVDMDVLKREDRDMLERIALRARETELSVWYEKVKDKKMLKSILFKTQRIKLCIKCKYAERGAIARHMKGLNLVELNIAWNRTLSGEDWKTVGRMAELERLNMWNCNVQAGRITKYMKELDLVELNVTWNRNLSDKDWKTVGRMTRLSRLSIRDCSMQAETIARHMKKLDLVELDVSYNEGLCDKDWETVGTMVNLERLDMEYCAIQAGTIARHMKRLQMLVKLNVSGNTNLSNEDWQVIGNMEKLVKLYLGGCDVQPGTIAQHMKGLSLAELDISWNINLNEEDWKTVEKMAGLEKLNIIGCNVQEEHVLKYLGRLKCQIIR